jgi:ATP-dependent Clp protease ATP-binding subunit ClpA
MQNNPEIENLIQQAIKLAQDKKHEYIVTEHLLLSMLRHEPFRATLEKFGVEVAIMDYEIDTYLNGLTSLIKDIDDLQPKKTQAIERIFNRANVQVMFTGRRTMTTVDVYLSMMAENNSHAHYFLLKYGVKKNEFVDFWQKNYKVSDEKMTDQQANDILTEYCTDLTKLARENRLEPLIGRATELQEMITVMARKFKANVLMVGDPGVGKTCIVDGLAQEIVAGRVPEFVKGHEVWSLEIGSL